MKNLIYTISALLFFAASILTAQEATVSESLKEFKTYPYSDPNPVANIGRVYPYYRFDGYAHEGSPQKWKVVTLENPYIKVFITPQIGGKIWGAMDKSSGRMFLYYNQVVKFRNIAMRGPWTSGGIESNFGIIGHAPTCSSPVDYILQENKDGSVSCVIGAQDLITGTVWSVDIRLPKDKAYFETNIVWHNPTPLEQPYYHWMNAAAYAKNDLHFYYPGHSYIGHDGRAHNWPRDEAGHDFSYYAQNNFGSYKSYHVLGEYNGFFGGYFHKEEFGFGNWSDYSGKPGKKLWIWGLSRQGMIWEDLLTDSDGQYIEWQSGRLFNQAASGSSETPFKHREFTPCGTDKWQEIWFPIKGTKGVKAASPSGILNYEHRGDKLFIYFCPLQHTRGPLTVTTGNKTLYNKQLDLKPLQLFSDSLIIRPENSFTIDAGGGLICSNGDTQDNYLQRPLKAPDNFDWQSVQGLALKGKEAARQHNYREAFNAYRQCLRKDPNYVAALNGMAALYFRRMDYDSALSYAKRSLSVDTYGARANYLYGVINCQLNSLADAKDGFSLAAHSLSHRSAAMTQLAQIALRENRWTAAQQYVQQALDYNRYNLSAREAGITAYRKNDQTFEALQAVKRLLQIDPLNHFARFEKYLLQGTAAAADSFKKFIRGELPAETYLRLTVDYHNIGLNGDALAVLQQAPEHPLVFYWQAYLKHLSGNEKQAAVLLKKAENLSPRLIFPFRRESAEVLNWALSQSSHWKTRYYLALIYWNRDDFKKAGDILTSIGNEADYVPFYLTRAKFLSSSDLRGAVKDCQKAMTLDKKDWRAPVMLAELYNRAGDQANSLKVLENLYRKTPADYRIAVPYAQALYRTGNYDLCLSVLDKTDVLPFEGAAGARLLFHNAHLMRSIESIKQKQYQMALRHAEKARLWPEHLGAGKPYDTNELAEDYLAMLSAEKMKDSDKAKTLQTKIDQYLKANNGGRGADNLIAALLLKKAGKNHEALLRLQEWQSEKTTNNLVCWALARFNSDKQKAETCYKKIKDNPNYRIYVEMVNLSL